MAKVILSLGTNLGNKQQNLDRAIELINRQMGFVKQKSSIYETEPWGFNSFNNFLNQVIVVVTSLQPKEVLSIALDIEREMGRSRSIESYEDRIIDIDLLLYDDLVLNDLNLKIPHPKLHLRKFVLEPLVEILPKEHHPVFQKSYRELLNSLEE